MTHRISVGFALLLGLAAVGCKDEPVTCGVPESTQDCDCSDGRTGGEQTCRNGAWTECVCPGDPIPADAMIDGATDGAAAVSGSGGTGGTGAIDGGSGTGGTGAVDGGAGTGAADGGSGSGGTGAVDGGADAGGTGGTGGSFPAPYTGPCTMDDDCGPDAVCLENGAGTDSHCAPTCDMASDCPAPGSGTATVECTMPAGLTEKVCRFQCFGAICPNGLTCDGIVPLASFCY